VRPAAPPRPSAIVATSDRSGCPQPPPLLLPRSTNRWQAAVRLRPVGVGARRDHQRSRPSLPRTRRSPPRERRAVPPVRGVGWGGRQAPSRVLRSLLRTALLGRSRHPRS
jgi:hypothetical protein